MCFSLTVEFGLPFSVSFPMTLAFAVVLGLAIERLALRPLIGEPNISVIMVTIGLSSVLKALVQLCWGTQIRVFPPVLPTTPVVIAGVPVAPVYIAAFALSLVFVFGLHGLLQVLAPGHRHAGHGLRPGRGRLHGHLHQAHLRHVLVHRGRGLHHRRHHPGQHQRHQLPTGATWASRSSPAVILGGLDSLAGAALGGLVIGVLENLCDGLAKDLFDLGGFKDVAAFAILVVILMMKPYGLFGNP